MTAPTDEAAIVGIGLVSAAGQTVDAFWRHQVAGDSFATQAADGSMPPGLTPIVCPIKNFDPGENLRRSEARRLDRFHQFGLVAARTAAQQGGLDLAGKRTAVVVGTAQGPVGLLEQQVLLLDHNGPGSVSPTAGPLGMPNSLAALIAVEFGITGPVLTLCTACASGSMAIGEALRLIREGKVDIAVAGGCDAMITPATAAFLTRLGALSRCVDNPALASRPFDRDRDGFVLGEGAGFLILTNATSVDSCSTLGSVLGYAVGCDAYNLVSPSPEPGSIAECMESALIDAGISSEEVGHVNAHGTSTPLNDSLEAQAITKVFGDTCPVTSTKGSIGHLLGGAGAVEAITAVLAASHLLVPPVAGLKNVDPDVTANVVSGRPQPARSAVAVSNSFGFGGQNASLVLRGNPNAATQGADSPP